MHIERLRLQDYRNLAPQRLEMSPGLQILQGPNGAGKRNLLEAVHLLTGWGPLPGRKTADVLRWSRGAEEETGRSPGERRASRALLSGHFRGETEVHVAAAVGRSSVLWLNESKSSATEVRSSVPSLIFLPEDLALVEGSPAVRRRFLDRLCALLLPLYAQRLHSYRRVLRQRGALLRDRRSPRMTTQLLVDLGSWVWKARERTALQLAGSLEQVGALLPGPLVVEFHRGGGVGMPAPSDDFVQSLKKYADEERFRRSPRTGPQRDDLLLSAGGREASVVFSRGQRRRVAVALMLAAGHTVARHLKRTPLLLLDEVAAELDDEGRRVLAEALKDTGWQVLAATAEMVPPEWRGTVWRLDDGRISRVEGTEQDTRDDGGTLGAGDGGVVL
ncbi:MAG: DNA replication and repair protein RecF [Synergistales bacterium]|nr:DNA replication and repair protein RecF [Synergistales bacterium]